jgi:hypothetical protein
MALSNIDVKYSMKHKYSIQLRISKMSTGCIAYFKVLINTAYQRTTVQNDFLSIF